jgi:small subunit ribosomal protein S20
MPKILSAKKALRQNIRRRARNSKQKELLKKTIKSFKKLVAAKKTKEAQDELKKVYKALDKAAKSAIIKKNTAARLKSRTAKTLAKALGK